MLSNGSWWALEPRKYTLDQAFAYGLHPCSIKQYANQLELPGNRAQWGDVRQCPLLRRELFPAVYSGGGNCSLLPCDMKSPNGMIPMVYRCKMA